jgi:hypothetical protein
MKPGAMALHDIRYKESVLDAEDGNLAVTIVTPGTIIRFKI